MSNRAAWTMAAVAGMSLLGGCIDKETCPDHFLTLRQVAGEYNQNAAQVPQVWARARIRATFSDGKGGSYSWGSASELSTPNGYLILSKRASAPATQPAGQAAAPDFVLMGGELSQPLFRVGVDGANGLEYLWHAVGDNPKAWFGRTQLAGAPGVESVPIDPLQLVELLGVNELPPTGPGAMPTIVMTLKTEPPCAYVVRYLRPQPVTGELKIWREVYFRWREDKSAKPPRPLEPARPFHVRLYDADGLCRVQADVSSYQPIEIADAASQPAQRPTMPTDFQITWPAIPNVQTAASLHLVLSDVSTKRVGPKLFDFWSHLPPKVQTEQVDSLYGPVGPRRGE